MAAHIELPESGPAAYTTSSPTLSGDQILCLQHPWTLSKNLGFQFHNRLYQLRGYGRGYRLRGARITVCEAFDGTLTLLHQGKVIDYSILREGERPIPLDDEKSVHHTVDQARTMQAQRPQWKPARPSLASLFLLNVLP